MHVRVCVRERDMYKMILSQILDKSLAVAQRVHVCVGERAKEGERDRERVYDDSRSNSRRTNPCRLAASQVSARACVCVCEGEYVRMRKDDSLSFSGRTLQGWRRRECMHAWVC